MKVFKKIRHVIHLPRCKVARTQVGMSAEGFFTVRVCNSTRTFVAVSQRRGFAAAMGPLALGSATWVSMSTIHQPKIGCNADHVVAADKAAYSTSRAQNAAIETIKAFGGLAIAVCGKYQQLHAAIVDLRALASIASRYVKDADLTTQSSHARRQTRRHAFRDPSSAVRLVIH